MPNRAECFAEILRYRILAVTAENIVKAGLQRRRQRAVVSGPQFLHAGGAGFLGHLQNVVALLQIEGIAHNVPAFFQGIAILGARRVFQNLYVRNILAEKSEAKRNPPRHFKSPAESRGSIFAIIVIQSETLIDRGEQNAGHGQRLRKKDLAVTPETG